MLFFIFFLFRVFAAVLCVARGHLVEVLGKTPPANLSSVSSLSPKSRRAAMASSFCDIVFFISTTVSPALRGQKREVAAPRHFCPGVPGYNLFF